MMNFINLAVCAATVLLGTLGFVQLHGGMGFEPLQALELVSLGIVGTWRWSQFCFRLLRSWYYQLWRFPRWRKVANGVPLEALPPMCLVVPSYQEQPWITERVFRAIVREAYTLNQPLMVFVSSSSDQENGEIRALVAQCDPESRVQLILRTQQQGKRKALADSLRELAAMGIPQETVIALMDGDSELAPGVLRQSLPFFLLFPKLGGLTTDEIPKVHGSYIFSEWFHLRFVQRHFQMCSDSLSRKVLCLTGRFSLFRGEAALHPGFADQLEFDHLDDWLWGRFKFLSGDDKSTWFWLLKNRYEMLYVPDVLVYAIETVSGSIVSRGIANMRRWFGNMLRNNSRALALGPKVTGWGIWYALVDQRLSIWTALVTPSILLLSLIQCDWYTVGALASWTLITRPLMLMLLFVGRKSYLKPIHVLLLVIMQWGSPLIKISVQMNLAQQKWTNRGNQSMDVGGTVLGRWVKRSIARFMIVSQMLAFGIAVLMINGQFRPWEDVKTQQFFREAARPEKVISLRQATTGHHP
jgi:mannuronan synthase